MLKNLPTLYLQKSALYAGIYHVNTRVLSVNKAVKINPNFSYPTILNHILKKGHPIGLDILHSTALDSIKKLMDLLWKAICLSIYILAKKNLLCRYWIYFYLTANSF